MYRILVINPGSTSTKIALYFDDKAIFTENIVHLHQEINKFNRIVDQYKYRRDMIIKLLNDKGCKIGELSAIVARGGILPPVEAGAYRVNNRMINRLKHNPVVDHASNLGALLADGLAKDHGIPSYIYDAVSVDQFDPLARVSGLKDIERRSTFHALNSKAVAIKTANQNGKKYEDCNFIVAHLGGGISLSAHKKGRIVDVIPDDEGPFSPERAGKLPCVQFIDLCYSGKYDRDTMHKKIRGNGGVKSYFNTTDMKELESMRNSGNQEASLIYEAMAYQISKAIAELSVVFCGDVDAIIITGGIANSKDFVSLIEKRVSFIANVKVMPGEHEMEGLALGVLRVLKGIEHAKEYLTD